MRTRLIKELLVDNRKTDFCSTYWFWLTKDVPDLMGKVDSRGKKSLTEPIVG
jgi:hypothetical protein